MSLTPIAQHQSNYRWILLTLAGITAIAVIGFPTISLSVLFAEISADLDMTLVQVGMVWSISSLTGMILGLIGGALGDRFGARSILTIALIGVGVMGAARGLALNFYTFIGFSFMMGLFSPLIAVNLHAVLAKWFSPQQLGLANGILASCFAAGFLFGAYLAASTFAPALGGWRPLIYTYGGISAILGIAWWILHPAEQPSNIEPNSQKSSILQGLPQVLKSRTLWLAGIGKIGIWGCMRGFSGYLPLYLRNAGWEPDRADLALSLFFVFSLLGAIPIPLLSDRLGTRKPFLILAALFMGLGVTLLGLTTSGLVFFAVILAGLLFDAFMGISITLVSNIKDLSGALVGTAIGVFFFMADIGGTLSPILGNALANISPELPFFLWGGLALLAVIPFYFLEETSKPKNSKI